MKDDIFQVLKAAFAKGASDIHLSSNEKIIFRISGKLQAQEQYPELSLAEAQTLIAQCMSKEELQLFQKNKDKDFAIEIPKLARFRVNTFFTTKGVNAVFRIIPDTIIPLEELHLPDTLDKIPDLKKGLVLVTGPTGSGKSTTLAAIIDKYNRTKKGHIVTIEDPVEFVHQSKQCLISHREVGKQTKSFASALRAAVRQDPDVVLVGEMRDTETISLALTAAEMGMLVFGTLHTSSASKTVSRIIDVFPADQQNAVQMMLSSSLRYVVAQVLLKKKSGGRAAATEILFGSQGVSSMIRRGETHQIPSAIQSGGKHGMRSLDTSIIALLKDETITYEEALTYISEPQVILSYKKS